MKKGFLILAIFLWTLVAVAVIGAIIFGINGGFGNMIGTGTLIKNEDVLLGNTQNIVVESSYQAVEIRKTTENSIKISQYGNEKTKDEKLFVVSASDGNVRIYFNNTWSFNFFNFNFNEKLVVEIPEKFSGNLKAATSSGGVRTEDELTLKKVELQSASGGIHINKNLTADRLDAGTSSGGIHINGNVVLSGNASMKSSSGGIHLNSTITAQDLNAKTNSGGIGIGTAHVGTYYLQTSSGGIKADSISGEGEAKASSGAIQLSLYNPKGDVKLTTSSGGIRISLQPSLQFTLDAKTSSGGIHTNFAIQKNEDGNIANAKIGDNPTVHIIAQASSGGIRVEK